MRQKNDHASESGQETDSVAATSMRLEKTDGSVNVKDEKGDNIELREKLPLYDGYLTETQSESYAWINLDDAKLAKLDMLSSALIHKEDRHLELNVVDGSLFFNITEPLKDEETMDIRTGTMVVGIRGTCGWVNSLASGNPSVYIVEGTVTCGLTDSNESVQVSSGEMAQLIYNTDGSVSLQVNSFSRKDIPEYVLPELDDTLLNSFAKNYSYTLPLSPEELNDLMQDAINQEDSMINIQAGEDNNLVIEDSVTIHGTLILEDGVTLTLTEHAQIEVDGTLEIHSDFTNDGSVVVLENGVLQVNGILTNNNFLSNGSLRKSDTMEEPVQNSHIISSQGIINADTFMTAGYTEGTLTQDIDSGTITLIAGNIDRIILNAGRLIERNGTCGELIQNGGEVITAIQGPQ